MTSTHPRRRADAERNVAAILDAARELFGRGGNPAMADIARAAGVGRVTLYGHFPSREQLLESVVDRVIADTDAQLSVLKLENLPAEVALGRLIETSWPVLDNARRLRRVAIAELGPDRLRQQHDRVFRHVEQLIARGQTDGVFRTDLPHTWLVATFYAILHAAADEVDTGRLASRRVTEILTSTAVSLLRPQ